MVLRAQSKRVPLYGLLFLAAVFVKQFYIFPSGSFQIGDLLFCFSFLFALPKLGLNQLVNANRKLFYFLIGACLVNGTYGVIYRDVSFVIVASYYVFNFLIVLVFDRVKDNDRFLRYLEVTLELCLLFQAGVYLSGSGKWMENARYQGTFNDPNQYGFFVISIFLLLSLIQKNSRKERKVLGWYIITFLLIIPCASTSMILALLVYIICHVLFSEELPAKRKIIRALLILVVSIILYMIVRGIIQLPASIVNSTIYQRTMSKWEGMVDGSNSFIEDRRLNILFEHPAYILWGGGEACYWRFGHGGEMHSTFFTLLWCNGIIPFGFLISWVIGKVKNINKSIWCIYIALFLESFTLVNHRQPMFWILITFAGATALKRNKKALVEVGQNESYVYTR